MEQQYSPFRINRRNICVIRANGDIDMLAWRLRDVNKEGNKLTNPNDTLGISYHLSYFMIQHSFATKGQLLRSRVIYAPIHHTVYGTKWTTRADGQSGTAIGELNIPKEILRLALPIMRKRMKLYLTYIMRGQ